MHRSTTKQALIFAFSIVFAVPSGVYSASYIDLNLWADAEGVQGGDVLVSADMERDLSPKDSQDEEKEHKPIIEVLDWLENVGRDALSALQKIGK